MKAELAKQAASYHQLAIQRAGRKGITMPEESRPVPSMRSTWPVGLRVFRKTTDDLGTVVEHDGDIKVKWDNGQTSYYRHGEQANVELRELKPTETLGVRRGRLS